MYIIESPLIGLEGRATTYTVIAMDPERAGAPRMMEHPLIHENKGNFYFSEWQQRQQQSANFALETNDCVLEYAKSII